MGLLVAGVRLREVVGQVVLEEDDVAEVPDQREMREISLRDIADRTKISRRYLEAMEADRFDLLPAPLFAKGFLLSCWAGELSLLAQTNHEMACRGA